VLTIDPHERTRIGSVELAGTPPASKADFLDRLAIAPGRPYESAKLSERIRKQVESLKRRGYYEAKMDLAARLGPPEFFETG